MWLIISIIGYFLNAIAAVVDKILISKRISNPAVYVFFISLLGLVGFVLAPWGFSWIGWWFFGVSLVTGASFVLALLYLFKALKIAESSRATPFIGGLSPIFVFLFSFFLLGERLNVKQIVAFLIIILGTVLISLGKSHTKSVSRFYFLAVFSALMFGLSYTLTKYLFNDLSFVNGFVWVRLTTFIAAMFLLVDVKNYQDIFHQNKETARQSGPLFLFGQVAGAVSFLLINYAISMASVTLVNALQGLQYAFLLILV
ncbi:MAG: DMT family transporter, partial [Candidatus Magasanikbacteria bacterium]|nr:DMT family transporter [Candidatus Magasanikbacteria bacterium]